MNPRDPVLCGVGLIPFAKPGRSDTYDVMGERAARAALLDAAVDYGAITQAYVGYVFGASTSGQAALYRLGVTGIPVVNVNNNCATGSTALWLADQAIRSGSADCVLALGFEQMQRGALENTYPDRPAPFSQGSQILASRIEVDSTIPPAAQLFGAAGQDYADKYGMTQEVFACVSVKARAHAANNPYALFRDPVTVEQVLASGDLFGPLTRLQCCPPTCGAAAAVLCSREFAESRGLRSDVVLRAAALNTDTASTFDEHDLTRVVGAQMTADAAAAAYDAAGVGPDDLDVVELHDCFTTNEVISYEALGLTPEGGAEKFILAEDNTYGGKVVVNPSGGLLSKGRPLGATGLAQCVELVEQLRGTAGARQVEGARIALQHNVGIGGACAVAIYERIAG